MCGDIVYERAACICSGTDLSNTCVLPILSSYFILRVLNSVSSTWSRYVLYTPRIKSVYLSTGCASSEDYRFSNPCRERLRTYIY